MNPFYFSLLSVKTKQAHAEYLEKFDRSSVFSLSSFLSYLDFKYPTDSDVRTDIIFMLGYSHGEFGIASTREYSYKITFNLNIVQTHPFFPKFNSSYHRKCVHFSGSLKTCTEYDKEHFVDDPRFLKYSWHTVKYTYLPKQNIIVSKLDYKKSVHFFFWKDTKTAKVFSYKTRLFKGKELNGLYATNFQFLQKLTQHIPQLNSLEGNHNMSLRFLLTYCNNRLWQDLNYNFRQTYVRDFHVSYGRLKRMYDKGDTKNLRKLFFGTDNKVLLRKLSKLSLESIKKFNEIERVLPHLQISDKEKILDIIDSIYQPNVVLPSLMSRGISLNSIIKHSLIAYDTESLFHRIEYFEVDPFQVAGINKKDNLRAIHDKLSIAYNRIKDAKYYGRKIELTPEEIKYSKSVGVFNFSPVDITDTLHTLGTDLNICVRSYDTRAIKKACTIVALDKEGSHYCCIEVVRNKIMQAKLHRNKPLWQDEECLAVFKSWCEENNLDYSSCRDVEEPIATRGVRFDIEDFYPCGI